MKTRLWLNFLLLLLCLNIALNQTFAAPKTPAAPTAPPTQSAPATPTTPAAPDAPAIQNTPAAPSAPAAFSTPSGPVFVIPLHGEVGPAQFYFLRRALKEAQRAKASAVVLDVDTLGGRVDSAMEEMDALLATRIPTIAYVNTKAISAGSLISLAAKRIYKIGRAHV